MLCCGVSHSHLFLSHSQSFRLSTGPFLRAEHVKDHTGRAFVYMFTCFFHKWSIQKCAFISHTHTLLNDINYAIVCAHAVCNALGGAGGDGGR